MVAARHAWLALLLAGCAAPRWGNAGAAFSYFIATAVIGLPFAWTIFTRARHGYLALEMPPECKEEAA